MSTRYDDDLFKDTTMTFGEHLEELRGALFKAVVGLVVGCLFGLTVGNYVVNWMEKPLTKALGRYYVAVAVEQFTALEQAEKERGRTLPYTAEQVNELISPTDPQAPAMLFEIHWFYEPPKEPWPAPAPEESADAKEQRVRAETARIRQRMRPTLIWHPVAEDQRVRITTLSAAEAFSIWIKASLVVGVVMSSPWVFYHIWAFVAAGLYPHEKKYVHVFLPFSLGLFLLGAATAYFFVFTPVLDFLFSFNKWLGLDPDPRISEWLSFVLLLPLGFGVSFQLPLVMLFLERIGVFDIQAYVEKWRVAVLVIFILSALLTPADPYSLLLMAIPLTMLYGGGILLCKLLPKIS